MSKKALFWILYIIVIVCVGKLWAEHFLLGSLLIIMMIYVFSKMIILEGDEDNEDNSEY